MQPPIKLVLQGVPHAQQEIIENKVVKMLKDGIVEPSDSPWSAPIILVKKKSQIILLCIQCK